MEKINLSDLLEPEHMDPVKRIALIRIVGDDGGVRESYKFLIESEGWRVKTYPSAEAFLEEDDPTVPGIGLDERCATGEKRRCAVNCQLMIQLKRIAFQVT